MTASKIEWTDRSDWNPIRGCTRVSQGCTHCYAESIAARFSAAGQPFHGFARRTSQGPRWTGKVNVIWERAFLPLTWRKPVKIFASSTSDFFHEALNPFDVASLFGVMIAAHHLRGHTFQVLTKRPERMAEWLNNPDWWEAVNAEAEAHVMERTDPLNRRSDDARATLSDYRPDNPPPGIWLGCSMEDQQSAESRRAAFEAVPAAVKFISYEPALGPLDLGGIRASRDADGEVYLHDAFITGIDWVICGGESGRGARPMHPDWARSMRDQCVAAGVPFFMKQWGEWAPGEIAGDYLNPERPAKGISLFDGTWSECWSEVDGHYDDEPDLYRVGKARAGRLLDGREWAEFPA